jgi:hypothetical protein
VPAVAGIPRALDGSADVARIGFECSRPIPEGSPLRDRVVFVVELLLPVRPQ